MVKKEAVTVVLGIDAAWTEKQPSGVAVVYSAKDGWHCAGVAPSYETFVTLPDGIPIEWQSGRFRGGIPDVRALIKAANRLARSPVDIVTIDMPIASEPITGRRLADNSISREFGARGCSAHSPNTTRPGQLGWLLSCEFITAGYAIANFAEPTGKSMRLLEVYPHPALLVLLQRQYRIPYKVGKSRNYWPTLTINERISAILHEFRTINKALTGILGPTDIILPGSDNVPTLAALKPYEDAIDALVSAWVGVCYTEGTAVSFGDTTSAIWCPADTDQVHKP
jgi:predicted RNase H-like nuclease